MISTSNEDQSNSHIFYLLYNDLRLDIGMLLLTVNHMNPLNARKKHHLAIGRPPDLLLALSKEDEGQSMQKWEQINDLSITVTSG